MKNVKSRGIPRQKDEFRGKFRGSNSAVTQIPRLGSKFRGPRKTVGPTDNDCDLGMQCCLELTVNGCLVHCHKCALIDLT